MKDDTDSVYTDNGNVVSKASRYRSRLLLNKEYGFSVHLEDYGPPMLEDGHLCCGRRNRGKYTKKCRLLL